MASTHGISKPPQNANESPSKRLPAIPPEGAQTATTPQPSPKPIKPHGQLFLEYSLMAEYKQLEKHKLPGLYVIPSAKTPLLWHGVLFIRQGIYQGGIFKFQLQIPESYPDGDCPRLLFEQPIFHPLIDPDSGELDVKRAFQKWRRGINHLHQVLLYARRVFYKIDITLPSNPEAAVLYEQDLELYKNQVAESIKLCKDRMYDCTNTDDPHAIRFSPYDPSVHDPVKEQMITLKEKSPSRDAAQNAQISGLSWMSHDSLEIFSSPLSRSLFS